MAIEQPPDIPIEESGIPSLSGSGLGSLAQSAHRKQLKVARGILLAVGIIVVLMHLFLIANTNNEVDAVVKTEINALHARGMQEDTTSVEEFRTRVTRICYVLYGGMAALGVIYVILGLMVYKFPVPATVLGLVLYIGSTAILGYLNPLSLAGGWLWKILIVVGLAKSIQAAIAYQKGMGDDEVRLPAGM
ncbi:MAG: hypothetical protein JW959_09970 [Pirellulales bacterium]|nr:hypothetical protein [Pirellulales bacterium]